MSTSLMFHGFGIRGYQLQNTEFVECNIYFHIDLDKHNLRCPVCKSSKVIRKRGSRLREFRSIPIGNKKTFIVFLALRIHCRELIDTFMLKSRLLIAKGDTPTLSSNMRLPCYSFQQFKMPPNTWMSIGI